MLRCLSAPKLTESVPSPNAAYLTRRASVKRRHFPGGRGNRNVQQRRESRTAYAPRPALPRKYKEQRRTSPSLGLQRCTSPSMGLRGPFRRIRRIRRPHRRATIQGLQSPRRWRSSSKRTSSNATTSSGNSSNPRAICSARR